jgi:hypothetical protein
MLSNPDAVKARQRGWRRLVCSLKFRLNQDLQISDVMLPVPVEQAQQRILAHLRYRKRSPGICTCARPDVEVADHFSAHGVRARVALCRTDPVAVLLTLDGVRRDGMDRWMLSHCASSLACAIS